MQSIWSESVKEQRPHFHTKLDKDITTDVLIIGGGLAGVLCAHRLQQAGVSCVLVEAKRIGSGVTQNTTGKVTAQHGLIYSDLIEGKGMDAARQYYTANSAALAEYRKLAACIPCDFEDKTAYVYSINNRSKLEQEAGAYSRMSVPYEILEHPPLPMRTMGALGMKGQAQFNPMKLLLGVAKGLTIYENTFVTDIKDHFAVTKGGRIRAKQIVLATHFPMVNIPGLYFVKMYQHRSYVLGLKNAPNLEGMFVDERQDGHSFRNYQDLLLVGGGDHRTGKQGGGYQELRRLVQTAYPAAQEQYAWATQDCMTLDAVPYIGVHRSSAQSLYVATGFNKWGMTGTMTAAMVLCDLITAGRSSYQELFSPNRSMMSKQLFINLLHATQGLLSFGKRCTHMGCALKWNPAEQSWDCPCHGSRYSRDGHILDNPAKRGKEIG